MTDDSIHRQIDEAVKGLRDAAAEHGLDSVYRYADTIAHAVDEWSVAIDRLTAALESTTPTGKEAHDDSRRM